MELLNWRDGKGKIKTYVLSGRSGEKLAETGASAGETMAAAWVNEGMLQRAASHSTKQMSVHSTWRDIHFSSEEVIHKRANW